MRSFAMTASSRFLGFGVKAVYEATTLLTRREPPPGFRHSPSAHVGRAPCRRQSPRLCRACPTVSRPSLSCCAFIHIANSRCRRRRRRHFSTFQIHSTRARAAAERK